MQVGLGSFLLRYLPGLLHSILSEMGVSEDMYYPVCKFMWIQCPLQRLYIGKCQMISHHKKLLFCIYIYMQLAMVLLAFLVLSGAWLGFWVVKKLILTKDGSVDLATSNFVAWSIRIFASLMILQVNSLFSAHCESIVQRFDF